MQEELGPQGRPGGHVHCIEDDVRFLDYPLNVFGSDAVRLHDERGVRVDVTDMLLEDLGFVAPDVLQPHALTVDIVEIVAVRLGQGQTLGAHAHQRLNCRTADRTAARDQDIGRAQPALIVCVNQATIANRDLTVEVVVRR